MTGLSGFNTGRNSIQLCIEGREQRHLLGGGKNICEGLKWTGVGRNRCFSLECCRGVLRQAAAVRFVQA